MPDTSETVISEVELPTIEEKLIELQSAVYVPKMQYNDFSNFNYRSAEDILAAVKPLLNGMLLTLSDKVVSIGGWNYVKATAKLSWHGQCLEITAYAREQEIKKGMDAAQISGACSSYARKYALNGMLLIDDVLDNDQVDVGEGDPSGGAKTEPKLMSDEHAVDLTKLIGDTGKSVEDFVTHMKNVTGLGFSDIATMPESIYQRCLNALGVTQEDQNEA